MMTNQNYSPDPRPISPEKRRSHLWRLPIYAVGTVLLVALIIFLVIPLIILGQGMRLSAKYFNRTDKTPAAEPVNTNNIVA